MDFSSPERKTHCVEKDGNDINDLNSLMNRLNSNGLEPVRSPRPERFEAEENKENSYPTSSERDESLIVSRELKHLTSTPAGGKVKSNIQLRSKYKVDFPEGSFFGYGRHKDGEEISKRLSRQRNCKDQTFLSIFQITDVLYQIRRVLLEDDSFMYCLWIARDPEEPAEGGRRFGTLTLASSHSETIDKSLGEVIKHYLIFNN